MVQFNPGEGVLREIPRRAGENAGLRDDAGKDGAAGVFKLHHYFFLLPYMIPAVSSSIRFTSAPMSLPSVPVPRAGEAFLQEGGSSLDLQRRYSLFALRRPAAAASFTTMLPEGQFE